MEQIYIFTKAIIMKTIYIFLTSMAILGFASAQDINEGLIGKYSFNEPDLSEDLMLDLSESSNHIQISQPEMIIFDQDRIGDFSGALMVGGDCYGYINENGESSSIASLDQLSFSTYNLVTSNFPEGSYRVARIQEANGFAIDLNLNSTINQLSYQFTIAHNDFTLFNWSADINETPDNGIWIWTHLGFTIDAQNDLAEFYVNGEKVHEVAFDFNTFEDMKVYLGRALEDQITCFDDLFIYDRITTAEEMEILFNTNISNAPTNVLDLESNASIQIFPNPVTNRRLHIQVDNHFENLPVMIFDQLGRVIDNQEISPSQFLNLAHLKTGKYFIRFKYEGKYYTKKIILTE